MTDAQEQPWSLAEMAEMVLQTDWGEGITLCPFLIRNKYTKPQWVFMPMRLGPVDPEAKH